jgi:hypothetical protein
MFLWIIIITVEVVENIILLYQAILMYNIKRSNVISYNFISDTMHLFVQ